MKRLTCLCLSIFCLLQAGNIWADEVVEIPDQNLRKALISTLRLKTGADITKEGLAEITNLNLQYRNIKDLTGLAFCTGLKTLSLHSNRNLSDISALATANLPSLVTLKLDNNQNLKTLASFNLPQLKTLSLHSNQISDIAPVHKNKTLSSTLSTLDFRYNPLSKVSILNYVPLLTKKIGYVKFTYPVGWDLINLDKVESYKISLQVSLDPNFILINSSVVVLMTLQELAETNRFVIGETVNLVVDRGTIQSPAVANGDGTYSAKYTADSTIGDVKIQAVTNSGTLASTKIRLVDTKVDRIVYKLDRNPNLASGHVLINSMNNLTLKLLDSKGELVSGEILDLSAGRGTIQSPAVKNSDGTYSAMYTAVNNTGSAAIKGIIKGSTDKRDLGSLKIQVVDI